MLLSYLRLSQEQKKNNYDFAVQYAITYLSDDTLIVQSSTYYVFWIVLRVFYTKKNTKTRFLKYKYISLFWFNLHEEVLIHTILDVCHFPFKYQLMLSFSETKLLGLHFVLPSIASRQKDAIKIEIRAPSLSTYCPDIFLFEQGL